MPENKLTSIEKFPPQLQKIAAYLALADRKVSIRQICKRLGLNYDSVRVQIAEARKKGNDFNELLNEYSLNWMRSKINEVDRKLYKKTISDSDTSPKYFETYYKRIGLLKESPLVNIDNRSVTVCTFIASPSPTIPKDIAKSLPEPDEGEMEIDGPEPGK